MNSPSKQLLSHDRPTYSWLPWPSSRSTTLKATAISTAVLILTWAFGNNTLRTIAAFILATPIVLVFSLLTLALSNIAFSILYTRRQRLSSTTTSATTTSTPRQQQHQRQKNNQRNMPGQTSRHMFHYLRPARFTRPLAWSKIEKMRRQEQAAKYRTPIADTMPQFSEAVDQVIELIIRDYVAGWMRAITPEVVLQQRIEELLRIVLIRLKSRVMDLDLTQLLVTRLVPKVTAHVNDFRKAEMALRGNSLERSLTESDELDIMVAGKFRNGKLHRALSTSVSTKATEEAYLRNVVQTILPTLLPKSEVQSEILRHLLRELLVGAVLRPVMDLLSDPDYWNQNVDLYTGKAIREQNMVKKLREALKQHTDSLDADSRSMESPADPYGPGADLYSFEDFLKMIRRCDSLLDVKRIRNTIMTQMRKKKALVVNREKDDIVNGNKVEDIIVYINRLDIARRRAEKRIEALGGPAYPKRRTRDYTPEVKNGPSLITLETVLTNPSGLSYFMEFQDRRENMNELQLWLLIDTLNIKEESGSKAEAESTGSLSSDEKILLSSKTNMSTPSSTLSKGRTIKSLEPSTPNSTQAIGPTGAAVASVTTPPPGSIRESRKSSVATFIDVTDTLREDVRMIYDTYFSDSAPRPVDVDHSLIKVFRDFALSDNSSLRSMSDMEARAQDEAKAAHVRRQLLVAQRQVFEQMSAKDYPEFVRSDLYFKFLTTYQNSLAEQNEGEESRSHVKPSVTQRTSPGPAILSAIGLTSPSNRREASENPKRSSTGSFLEIFGLGRDRDKERDSPLRRAETTIGNLRPGFLTPSSSRSKTSSPSSIRAFDTGSNSTQASDQHRSKEATPKKSLDIPSTTAHIPTSLGRPRSLSSISSPDILIQPSSGGQSTSHRKSSSAVNHGRDNSLDLTDTEGLSRSITEDGNPALRDSLIMELQEQEEEDDDNAIEGGLAIPRMPEKKRANVIDKMEAALTSIMENQDGQPEDVVGGEKDKGSGPTPVDLTDPSFSTARDGQPGAAALMEWGRSQEKASRKRFKEKNLESGKTVRVKSREASEVGRPSLGSMFETEKEKSTAGLQSEKSQPTSQRNSIFSDNDDGDEQKSEGPARQSIDSVEGYSMSTPEKRRATKSTEASESISDAVQDNVHLAAPGDLLLAARIKNLEQDIEMLRKQEAIVETLIQKAEQKGRQDELRILKKSKSALRREILSMEYQKTQYEVQEEENMIMPGRSTINITSSTVGNDGSKEFALYVIEVHQLAQDGSFASGWVIARRYSEFFALHQQLKENFSSIVRQYELPGKRGFLKLQKSFVEGRRIGLERYLQSLVRHIEICQSQELRAFLSQENVALPQFSASTPALTEYNPSDLEQDKGKSGGGSSVPVNQHFFEQLFHSATSPLHSPIASREPSKGLFQSASGVMSGEGLGLQQGIRDADVNQNEGFMKHIYQTVSEGLDDMFSGGPPTVLGDITKKLGNQMMQFSMEDEDEKTVVSREGSVTSPAGSMSSRRRHGSHGESGSVRLHIDPVADGLGPLVQQPPQRPPLQRIHSARSRRLSSPDPHTQHQKLQIQKQEQQYLQHSRQSSFQEQQHLAQQQQLQQQLQQQQQQQQLAQQQSRPAVVEAEGVTMFTEPLCDLFIELFELKEKNNWLRRQAVVIILQQVLGGTIERKLRDTIKTYIEENMLTFYVTKLRDSLWPPAPISPSNSATGLSGGYEIIGLDVNMSPKTGAGGASPGGLSSPGGTKDSGTPPMGTSAAAASKKPVRTAEQKATTKDQANRKLSAFLPELLGNMVGQQNARRGARRVFAAFQNRRLNQQLVYTTLDEVIAALWPELDPNLSTAGASTNAGGNGAVDGGYGGSGGGSSGGTGQVSGGSGGVGGPTSGATTSTSTTTAQSSSTSFSHSSLVPGGAAAVLAMSAGGDGGNR
ncbi:Intermediate filament protein [Linnemannia zychae]|nr:Intermediate filament protein [Linnemannia zychae]